MEKIQKNYMKISNGLFLVFFTLAFLGRFLNLNLNEFIRYGLGFLILLPLLRLIFFVGEYRKKSEFFMLGACLLLTIILITGFYLR